MPPLPKDKTEKSFQLESNPHVHARHSVRGIFWGTVAALAPVWIGSLFFFGLNALRIVFITVISTVLFECLFRVLIGKKIELQNGSAVLSAVLFAFLMPPEAPWWLLTLGSFIAVIIGKEIFGGLGQNLFHPALVGYCALFALLPGEMIPRGDSVFMLGGASRIAIFISGALLIFKRWIPYEMPLLYLVTVALVAALVGGRDPRAVLDGGVFLGAFFLLTDSVTSPITKPGRGLFAVACGMLTAVLHSWQTSMAAVAFSILLMNSTVPLLDRYVRPRSKGLRVI